MMLPLLLLELEVNPESAGSEEVSAESLLLKSMPGPSSGGGTGGSIGATTGSGASGIGAPMPG
jgi:hypothetical protein